MKINKKFWCTNINKARELGFEDCKQGVCIYNTNCRKTPVNMLIYIDKISKRIHIFKYNSYSMYILLLLKEVLTYEN